METNKENGYVELSLSEFIVDELYFLGINLNQLVDSNLEVPTKDAQADKYYKTIRYYLKKNFEAILGKDKFIKKDQKSTPEIEISKDVINKRIDFLYAGLQCSIWLNDNGELTMSSKETKDMFQILIWGNNIVNSLMTMNEEDEIIKEYQNVNIKEDVFSYQKIIQNKESIEKYPKYSVKPVNAKLKEGEIYEITMEEDKPKSKTEKNSIIKEYIEKLKRNKMFTLCADKMEVTNHYDNLEKIFVEMEERSNTKSPARK